MNEDLKQALRQLILRELPPNSVIGIVKGVDTQALVCDVQPIPTGAMLLDVRLTAAANTNDAGENLPDAQFGIALLPALGSYVLCEPIAGNRAAWYVAKTTELSGVVITGPDMLIHVDMTSAKRVIVDAPEILINGGQKGGLVNVNDLKTDLAKVNDFMTRLKTILGGAPIPEPGAGSPSALQAALQAALTGHSNPTYNAIENTKVKH